MKNLVTALCASAIALAPVAATAQDFPRQHGGWGQHGDRGGGGEGMRLPGGPRGDWHRGEGPRFRGYGWGRGFDRGFGGRDRRDYDRDDYQRWMYRQRGGYGCSYMGWDRGCYTIHSDPGLFILNLLGDVYCYSRAYNYPIQVACPRNWYDY